MRSVHMKLVMIMVLLILSLMTVVGAFLVNSVATFYLKEFYTQVAEVFSNEGLVSDLRTQTQTQENAAEEMAEILRAYSGELGVDRRNRRLYILDENGVCLIRSDGESTPVAITKNLAYVLAIGIATGEAGDKGSLAEEYMDVAIPIRRGHSDYIIYILDNKQTMNALTGQMILLIIEALLFGLVISILLSFLLSKTMVTPIQRLTDGAMRVARGDFSRKITVASQDEIGVLTQTFNSMAQQLRDTLAQVENERNKLDTLFLHMTDGVVAFSHSGQVIHHNPAAVRMLHRPIDDTTTYDTLFADIVPLEQVLITPDHIESERKMQDTVLLLLLAAFDRGREGGGALVVLHDITQQRKNQEMQREFVANVSHELRTPLTNIRSYAETLSDGAGDVPLEMQKKFLGVILNESDRMTSIVQDLLTLSRIDTGHGTLKLAKTSFAQMVQDVYNAVYMDAQRHNHTLTLVQGESLPEIVADRARIMQVMMNIVSNAIKYTPDGGEITLKTGQTNSEVWLLVDDNGCGIPPEDRGRIFDRFYRVDKARSRQSGGTGLGLSIARELAVQHQGELCLVDKDTQGLCVRLTLKIKGPQDE